MEAEFWRARWREGRIGFHLDRPNPHLVRHAAALFDGQAPGAQRILVPLCGKSVDLAWLAAREGAPSVVGVELVEDAARAFFTEQGLPAHRTHDGPLVRWEGGTVEIVVGDFFDVTRAELGGFAACFDRAALVALPPATRPSYVAHLRSLLDPGARVLLVTFEHDAPGDEPPFSVPEPEVRALWTGCRVDLVADEDLGAGTALATRGARSVRERVYRIELPA
jgi:thiopurine S-methyltransferase